MEQTYQHLLSLEFQHKYFKNNLFRSLQVSYDRDMASLLLDLGIVLKSYRGGLHILALNPELLKVNGTIPIRLYLECNDPYYINYTLLPTYTPNENILYFNNLGVVPDASASKLHQEEFVGSHHVVPLSYGRITINDFSSDKRYHFHDALGNEIPMEHFRVSHSNPQELSISDFGQGIVRQFADGEEGQTLYYSPNAVWKKPLGVIELYPGQLYEHYGKQGKLDYVLAFAARKTIWKYFLLDSVYQNFENLSIINGGTKQLFHRPKKTKVQDREALMFESTEGIELSEFSEDNFQLIDNYNPELGSGKIVIKYLPRASAEQLYHYPENSGEFIYSHIYM